MVACGSFLSNDSYILLVNIKMCTTNKCTGSMGSLTLERLPYTRVSRIHHKLFRQGISHSTPSPILISPFRPEANFGWFHWLSKHGQVVYHQHLTEKESLYRCTYSWRDQDLAIHHSNETNLSHRLPWCCSSQYYRYSARYSPSWSRPSGER